jgi:hypothetical protein
MLTLEQESILKIITDFFTSSRDFNGISTTILAEKSGLEWNNFIKVLCSLIEEDLVGVIYSDTSLNPHIIRLGFEQKQNQISKLSEEVIKESCTYPCRQHLENIVDKTKYRDMPYSLPLALGEPQLNYRSFDLSVLEAYRNDPCYIYKNNDISGWISVSDDFYESNSIQQKDKILLESFGFAYNNDFDRAVAVFLTYLSSLSPEHQQIWLTKELKGDYRLHPDYYRNSIVGDWGEKLPIFDAFISELYLINQMAEAMKRPKLFRSDFGKYGENKPLKFSFLVRPTLAEFNDFVLLLDKMLSENLNKDFFKNEVSFESEIARQDGKIQVQNRGTLQILDDWIRKSFRTSNWEPWGKSIATMRHVRKLRQQPAHAIHENDFNQNYFRQQRKLIIEAFDAVRTLRMLLENHPLVRSSNIDVPIELREGRIWNY